MWEEDVFFAGAIGIFVAIVIALGIGLYVVLDSTACTNVWTDFPHRWGFWSSCMVQIDGKWYPADAVKAVTLKKGSNS